MRKGHLPSADSGTPSRSSRAKGGGLSRCVDLWIADGQAAGWSARILASRRDMLAKFSWWLSREGESERLQELSSETLRFFLAYLRDDSVPERWENGAPNTSRPAHPSTVDTYYRCLRAFFNFALREGLLAESPMRKLKPPRLPKDQVQPFTQEQAQSLVEAAKRSDQGLRDTALLLVLLDTGLRVSELCSLTVGDVDPETKALRIQGKGGKRRVSYLSAPVLQCSSAPRAVALRGARTAAGGRRRTALRGQPGSANRWRAHPERSVQALLPAGEGGGDPGRALQSTHGEALLRHLDAPQRRQPVRAAAVDGA